MTLCDWLVSNLNSKLLHGSKISWSLLFGIMIWRLWNSRNLEVVVVGGVRQRNLGRGSLETAFNYLLL